MGQYLSVVEFAAAAGISKQAVYKSIKNGRLAAYVIEEDGKKLISKEAVNHFQPKVVNQSTKVDTEKASCQDAKASQPVNQEQSTSQPISTTVELYLLKEIDELKAIIQEKDRLIAEQATQLAAIAKQNADIAIKALAATTNQQTLAALDKAPPPQIEEQTPQPEPKKGFWKMLFSKPTNE